MSFTQYCEHGGVVCQECVIAKDAQIAALEKDIIRLTGAWVAEEQKVAALEAEVAGLKEAERRAFECAKTWEQAADDLKAEVERLNDIVIGFMGDGTESPDLAPFVALAKVAHPIWRRIALFGGM